MTDLAKWHVKQEEIVYSLLTRLVLILHNKINAHPYT